MTHVYTMGWLWLVGSTKLEVSFAKEPYGWDDVLQKRPKILWILLTVATPYVMTYTVWGRTWRWHCNTLQHTATHCDEIHCMRKNVAMADHVLPLLFRGCSISSGICHMNGRLMRMYMNIYVCQKRYAQIDFKNRNDGSATDCGGATGLCDMTHAYVYRQMILILWKDLRTNHGDGGATNCWGVTVRAQLCYVTWVNCVMWHISCMCT